MTIVNTMYSFCVQRNSISSLKGLKKQWTIVRRAAGQRMWLDYVLSSLLKGPGWVHYSGVAAQKITQALIEYPGTYWWSIHYCQSV
jgi:hypothetical protein